MVSHCVGIGLPSQLVGQLEAVLVQYTSSGFSGISHLASTATLSGGVDCMSL